MRLTRNDAYALLLAAGLTARDDGTSIRVDSGETGAFLRQLTHIIQKTFDRRYPDLMARTFIPVNHEVPAGAEAFVYRSWDWAGAAKIIDTFADDLPMIEVIAGEIAVKIKSLGNAYAFSIQDMRAAAMAGTPLDAKRAAAVRRAMENAVEQIAALGNAAAGLPGFLNNPNVPLLTAPGQITGNWPSATPKQILADLHSMANTMATSTKLVFKPDTMLLPPTRYALVASTPVSDLTPQTTILRAFLETSPYIKGVDQWPFLETADAAGTGPRAVVYGRSPDNVELFIPQEFEQLPPQWRNLAAQIACHMRIAGVVWYYPLAGEYVDGI